ncbi:MAG TPA: hypothetical protein VF221_04200 [Chloroflexota bacterium]
MATHREPDQAAQRIEAQRRTRLLDRDDPSVRFAERYEVRGHAAGDLQVQQHRARLPRPARTIRGVDRDRFFVAEKTPEGTYTVTMTEEGIATFETALGIANDLGRNSLISPYSTIADIMERTATREELSEEMRREDQGLLHWLRILVLRRKLRGSERPMPHQQLIGHMGKLVIVGLFIYWTLQHFYTAVQDIVGIPGILAGAPTDILHPTAVFGQIGSNISDAGTNFMLGLIGIHLVFIVGALIRPFARIYRKDQVVSGERWFLRVLDGTLRRVSGAARRTGYGEEPAGAR